MSELEEAAQFLAETLSIDADTASMVGPSLACSEVDAIALMLDRAGQPNGALNWINSHVRSESEEDGDLHFEVDPEKYLRRLS